MSKKKQFRQEVVKLSAAALMFLGAASLPFTSSYGGQQGGGSEGGGQGGQGGGQQKMFRMKSVQLNRNNLSKLSNKLYNSPTERRKFMANPKVYAESMFGGKMSASDSKLKQIKNVLADGFCCDGCGCGSSGFNSKF